MATIKISNMRIIEDALKNIAEILKKELDTESKINEISNKIKETFIDIPRFNIICKDINNYSKEFYDLRIKTIKFISDLEQLSQQVDIIPEDGMW